MVTISSKVASSNRQLLQRKAVTHSEGGCDAPLWVQGKALVGTMQQSSRRLQGFSTLRSLTFD